MMHHRKLNMLKHYGHAIRLVKINQMKEEQEKQYAAYFLQDDQKDDEKKQEEEVEEQPEVQIEDAKGEDEDGDGGEFSVADYIGLLSKEEREAFQQDNPQLPALFFMTKKEKKKYFQDVNNQFKKTLEKIPQRATKTKKILKFKNQFQVKPFSDKQKVTSVKQAKQIHQTYQPKIHFS